MWLRLQKLTQGCSEPSFLINKTGTPCRDEISQIKPVLWFFLNEFLKSLLFRCQKRVYGANRRLSTFFQIDFEVIRMMRSKDFNFSFAENISKFMILGRDIGKLEASASLQN